MGIGLFPLIFLLFIAPDLIDLFIPIIFFYGLAMLFKNFRSKKRTTTTSRYSFNQKTANSQKTSISNSDIVKIDKRLKSYFKENVYLNVVEGIDLTTANGTYTNIDDLYVTYKKEKVCRLSELRNSYSIIYDRLVSLLLTFSKQSDEVLKEEVNLSSKPKTNKKEDKKPTVALSDAQKYIDKINELNNKIPNEEITNGLYQTCDLLKQIDLANGNKKLDDKLRKLYDYYLPILVDVLTRYDELDDSPIRGEEFNKTENKLIKTIVLINEALKTIYSGIHEEDYMNLNADITTLQSLLNKDGLVSGSPFKEAGDE